MATRQTEKLTLTKSNRLLYPLVGLEGITSDDEFGDPLIFGQDYKIEDGKIELLNESWLGRHAVVTYSR